MQATCYDKNKDINLDFWIEFKDLFEHKEKEIQRSFIRDKQKVLIIQALMTKSFILIQMNVSMDLISSKY